MKTVIRLLCVTAVFIFCTAAFQSSVRAGGNGDDEYTITVNGGHATNMLGETVTKAKPGTEIIVYHDVKPGKYWTGWTTDLSSDDNTIIFHFTMPAKPVTITAETVAAQKTYTLDLTEMTPELSTEDLLLLENAFICWKNTTDIDDLDLDKDGHIDLQYVFSPKGFSRWGLSNYSLGTLYEVKIPDGEIGTVRIVIDNDTTSTPVRVADGRPHTIIAEQGTVYMRVNGQKSGEYRYEEVSEAAPGEYIDVRLNAVPKGKYVADVLINGVSSRQTEGSKHALFYMPPRDVTIEFVFGDQIPYTLDLSEGPVKLDIPAANDFRTAIHEAFPGKLFENISFGIDFDKDFDWDIVYTRDSSGNYEIEGNRTPYTTKNQKVRFSGEADGKYWPVTVIFPDYENIPVTPTPTPTIKPAKAPTATPTVTPTEEQPPTPSPVVWRDKNDGKSDFSARGYALIVCAILFFVAAAIVLFLLLKKDAPQPPKNLYNEWNEDRMTILPGNDDVTTGKQPGQNKPPVSDVKPEDDGNNDNPGSIV